MIVKICTCFISALAMFFVMGTFGFGSEISQDVDDAFIVTTTEKAPNTLAILPFDNNSITHPEKYSPLSKGVAAMLITDLNRAGTSMKLIERTKIQSLLKEVALSQSGAIDQSTAIQVGKMLGAQSIAFGSFMVVENTVRMDLRIIKVETSELIMAEKVIGDSNNFIQLEQDLAQKIAQSLKVAFQPEMISGESSISAALYFSQGVEALDNGDHAGAKELFDKAISIDPSYKQQVENINGPKQ
jgi:TolB-like protein